ncbi:putative bifunctional diguanylate cyclase/phosphodiesterase [Clostridium thermarum]|uniref:putative bifunctional diguanylate cyclase/phosphodiesterase n=1 Tax=Clostridium thermarum TaxID=1716543 RepID=UPI00111F669C|nr:EAL domain-containing protein [Clostridium thermarum]
MYDKNYHYVKLMEQPDRRYLNKYYKENKNKEIALVFLDIDNLKLINDAYGHIIGDEVLIYISKKLINSLDDNSMVFRFGGDEFILIFVNKTKEDIQNCIENIMSDANKVFRINNKEIYTTVSAGIYIPSRKESLEEIIRKANIAMYHSKQKGKNRYTFFNEDMDYAIKKKADLIIELKKAVEEDKEFYVVYQPIYNVKSRKIEAVEALARWNNNKYSEIPPSEFIPLLEETGLIEKFGLNIIKRIFRDIDSLTKKGFDIRFNINVSPIQLRNNDFFYQINTLMKKYGINIKNIFFELTETQILNLKEDKINEVIERGAKIALDDFGTGYSSIINVMQLPISEIKINKFIIDKIEEDEKARILIQAIVYIAGKLRAEVVVEGVENKKQYDILKKLGIKNIQGYFISKPKRVEDLIIDLKYT